MITSKKKLRNFSENYWPVLLMFGLVILFFWKVFIKSLVPLPADFIVGTYYPWLSYDWGIAAGVPVKNPVTSDVVSVIYPLRTYAFQLLRSGIRPLWNPLMFGGYPLLANFQVAIFSPTSILYLFLDEVNAWSTQVILQPIFSSLFMYLLLRKLGVKKLSSSIGGTIYAFSGFSMIWLEWNAHSLTASWIPFLIYLCLKYSEEQRTKNLIFISISLALMIFSGYPQLIVYALATIGIFISIFRFKTRNAIILGLFLGIGVLLTSIQTLPAMELLNISQRDSEEIDEKLGYLPYKHLVNLFAPDYFGNQATGNFWGDGNYTNTAAYTGVITLVLGSLAATSTLKEKKTKFFVLVFVSGLLFTLKSPISELIYSLGIIGSTAASSTRSLIMVNFALSGLFAVGMDNLSKFNKKHHSVLLMPGIVLFASFFYAFTNGIEVGYRNLILPSLLFLVSSGLVFSTTLTKNKRYVSIVAIVLSGLVISELFRFGWKYTPFSPKEYIFPKTELTDFLQTDTLNRIHFSDVVPMNFWVSYKLSSLGSYDAVYPENIAKYIAVNNSQKLGVREMSRHGSLENNNSKMFNVSGVNRLLSLSSEYDRYDDNYSEVFNDGKVYVYENETAVERAKLYYDWKIFRDIDDRFSYLISDDYNFDTELVLPDEINKIRKPNNIVDGKTRISKYSNQDIIIEVETSSNALLYLSDTYYPGWEVYVDGERGIIIEANNAFRAVPVKKGTSKVRFIYDPISFRIGMWLSGATFLFLVTLTIYDYKKNSRRTS